MLVNFKCSQMSSMNSSNCSMSGSQSRPGAPVRYWTWMKPTELVFCECMASDGRSVRTMQNTAWTDENPRRGFICCTNYRKVYDLLFFHMLSTLIFFGHHVHFIIVSVFLIFLCPLFSLEAALFGDGLIRLLMSSKIRKS